MPFFFRGDNTGENNFCNILGPIEFLICNYLGALRPEFQVGIMIRGQFRVDKKSN